MNENRTIHLVDIPIGGEAGLTWNRLHEEREHICEALLKDHDLLADKRGPWLQARLRRIDDALDRMMSGSYGNCSKCGQAIDDTILGSDPTQPLCLKCWTGAPATPARPIISSGNVVLENRVARDSMAR